MSCGMLLVPNAASVALIDRDRVLLIRRARAPSQHLWTLPGGRREGEETPEACAKREVFEELGLNCFALKPIGVRTFEASHGEWRLAVFATEAFEGEILTSDEVAEYRWARLADLPGLATTDRLNAVVERAFAIFDRT